MKKIDVLMDNVDKMLERAKKVTASQSKLHSFDNFIAMLAPEIKRLRRSGCTWEEVYKTFIGDDVTLKASMTIDQMRMSYTKRCRKPGVSKKSPAEPAALPPGDAVVVPVVVSSSKPTQAAAVATSVPGAAPAQVAASKPVAFSTPITSLPGRS